jgi:CheY-like chemotaxis protein
MARESEASMGKILLADDHAPTRMMLSRILTGQEYEVRHAGNGAEAYAVAVIERPDLVLLDVQMPVMDGYEALAMLKEDPVTRPVQVMMLTASDRPLDRRLAREMGAVGYIVKPVRIDELCRIVGDALTANMSPPPPQPAPGQDRL